MKLYEITSELATAIQRYNQVETDEELAGLEKILTDLQVSFQDKAVAVAHHILNVDADITAIESELQRLGKLIVRAKKESDWFRRYLQSAMEATNNTEIKTPTLQLKIKKNPPSVIVEDESVIPIEYKRERIEVLLDKKAIKASWDSGVGVAGTKVEQKTRLEIK